MGSPLHFLLRGSDFWYEAFIFHPFHFNFPKLGAEEITYAEGMEKRWKDGTIEGWNDGAMELRNHVTTELHTGMKWK